MFFENINFFDMDISYVSFCQCYFINCYFYKAKLTEFDDKLEGIEKQMKCCKDEMTEISKRYIELCRILYNLKKDKIKVNKDKTLFIYKNKNI